MRQEQYKKMDDLEKTNWWYRGRRSIVRMLFKKYSSEVNLVLDVGCGTGEGASIIGSMAPVVGVDINDEALELAKGKGYQSLHKISGEQLPFPGGSFSTIIMLDVLEHIIDDRETLRECSRVLRSEGTVFITVPAYQWMWSGHDEVFGHQRRYLKKELLNKATEVGFDVVFCSYYVTILFPLIALFRAFDRVFSKKASSHFFYTPRIINQVLFWIMQFEKKLLESKITFPFGSSIVAVLSKK